MAGLLKQQTDDDTKRKKEHTETCSFRLKADERKLVDDTLAYLRTETKTPKLKLSFLLRHAAMLSCQLILDNGKTNRD
jgi:hypothetical protein